MIYSDDPTSGGIAINGKIIGGTAAGLGIFLVVLIVLSFWWGQNIVDIVLIVVAFCSFLAFALLGYAAWQVVGLIKEVRGEVDTLIGTAKDTMREVQGTARFVNETVVRPTSQAAAFVSATRATLKSFTEPLYKRGK